MLLTKNSKNTNYPQIPNTMKPITDVVSTTKNNQKDLKQKSNHLLDLQKKPSKKQKTT